MLSNFFLFFSEILYSGTKSYKPSFKDSGRVNVTGSTSRATVTNLFPHTVYQIRVSTNGECGQGTFSDPVSFTTELDSKLNIMWTFCLGRLMIKTRLVLSRFEKIEIQILQ